MKMCYFQKLDIDVSAGTQTVRFLVAASVTNDVEMKLNPSDRLF